MVCKNIIVVPLKLFSCLQTSVKRGMEMALCTWRAAVAPARLDVETWKSLNSMTWTSVITSGRFNSLWVSLQEPCVKLWLLTLYTCTNIRPKGNYLLWSYSVFQLLSYYVRVRHGSRTSHIHHWPYEETNRWWGLKMSKNDTENVPNLFYYHCS